jgi:hypothetical protein
MGDNNDRTQISVGSSDVALYSRPARQQNLFLHNPNFASLPPRYMKDGRCPHASVAKFPTCWTGKSLDSSTIKSHGAHDGLLDNHASDTVASADVSGGIPLGRHPQRMRKLRFHLVERGRLDMSFHDFIQASTSARRWANRVVYTRLKLRNVNPLASHLLVTVYGVL